MNAERVADGVYYRIDRNYCLHVFGKGDIPDYVLHRNRIPPWAKKLYSSVYIERGITGIGSFSFFGNPFIQNIRITDTVELIHPTAFLGVELDAVTFSGRKWKERIQLHESGLYDMKERKLWIGRDIKHVKIMEGVIGIDSFAFAFHKKVETVECPKSLNRIGISAFRGCESLREISRLPNGTKLGLRALDGTSNVKIFREAYKPKNERQERREGRKIPAITEHGSGYLKDGMFWFVADKDKEKDNIDPTKLYRCTDLIDIKGGKDFILGLRSTGEVVYARLHEPTGMYSEYRSPFKYEEHSSFERLTKWEKVCKIEAHGTIAAGLREDGLVYCTEATDENEPVKGLKEIEAIQVGEKLMAVNEKDEIFYV